MNLNDLPDMSDALRQVQMYEAKKKGDGNLANNAVPYDKVTKADIITGALGRDEKGGKAKPKGHDCAKLVKYAPDGGVKEEFETIPEQHTLLEDGTVTHYDITDGEWIYENVPVEELEIVISEKHEHFVNYDKNAEVLGEDAKYDRNRKRAAERAAARNAARAAGKTGVVPGVGYVSPRPERETYVDSAGVTRHKSGAKMPKKEEVEQYVDFLVDEGYDCSELTWEEITEEYETLDEGLRSAVKRLLGKKDAPAEKKPESRGEQLRKKYNVGPERSDTSAKRQILDRTRAKAERDKKEFGGSRYSKSVSDKSAAAHDRYLRAGYSKYGADDRRGSGNKARKRAAALKGEAFAFSDAEWEELAMLGEEIDAMTDEQLIDFMEEIILEVAEDDQDLIEICEALEEVEVISERMDPKEIQRRRDQAKDRLATGAAMKKAAASSSDSAGPSRLERMKSAAKSAAKRVGSAAKAGAKMAGRAANKAGKAAVTAAGKAAGTYQGEKEAARIKAKRASMEKTPPKKKETSSDDDGTGGKLDALLKSTRGTSSSSDSGSKSGGGGESSSSSDSSGPGILKSKSSESGSTRKAVGGALKSAAKLVGRGIKKAVGKTARAVSSGSDKLAKRLGEDYEHIAHLYESGLFTMQEIENVIEERYKGKHGQSDKEYADSRSQGGKMVSGDSKQSGAEYTHGRRVKAANPGMQPDVGGKTKPKSQGKMDRGTRADLEYRKANLKAGK